MLVCSEEEWGDCMQMISLGYSAARKPPVEEACGQKLYYNYLLFDITSISRKSHNQCDAPEEYSSGHA